MRLPLGAICLAFVQAILIGGGVRSETLGVGDPAPKLDVSQWVKGEKVDRFNPARIYVVEFWATWCEPCRFCMPHLTQLQKKYKDDVTFIGVSVHEPDRNKVEPFVKKMADKMEYRVALDNVPNDAKDGAGGMMAETWLTAAGENGIPVAFIVKDGKIAWIGHPTALDEPLAKAVAGKWDFEAAANERRLKKEDEARVGAIFGTISSLVQQRKYQEALAGINEAIIANPEYEHRLGLMKVTVLIESQDDEGLIAYSSKLMDSVWKENYDALNFLALMILVSERKPKPSPSQLTLAMKAAERAKDLTHGESGRSLDTLARVCFASGEPERAAQLEERALTLAEGDAPQWKERLETYRKAAEEKGR